MYERLCRYQGWGTSAGNASYAGYGAAGAGAGPGNYQGWGAPPAPQAPPHAPAWPATNNYTQHTQPPAQGYGSYGTYRMRYRPPLAQPTPTTSHCSLTTFS